MENKKLGLRPIDVAMELGIGITVARDLIKCGDMKSIKIGRSVVVPRTELEAYLARMMQSAGGSPDAKGNPDAGDDEGAKRSSPRD